ncbi:hypothetical protein C8Q75DRAFT_62534 [Abortiporus biennis]|nr:hypothetical protein C8Q75DRAFT_62534 [Abortiporus biennis]
MKMFEALSISHPDNNESGSNQTPIMATFPTSKVAEYSFLEWEDFRNRITRAHSYEADLNNHQDMKELDTCVAQISTDKFLNEFAPPKLNPEEEKIKIENICRDTEVADWLLAAKDSKYERYLPLIYLVEPGWRGTGLVPHNVSCLGQDSGRKVTSDIVAYSSEDNGRTLDDETTTTYSSTLPPTPTVAPTSMDTSISSQAVSTTSTSSDVFVPSAIPDDHASMSPPSTNSSSSSSKELGDDKGHMDYHYAELFIEDKTENEFAALHNDEDRGEHAGEILRCQRRCHLFSIMTVHSTARFLRWDRSGVIASMPVNFGTESGLRTYITFLYRFARMTTRERGHDTTVLEPAAADLQRLEDFKTDKLESLVATHEEFFNEAFENKVGEAQWPMRVIEVEPFAPKSTRLVNKKIRLLIRVPRVSSRSPFGRATKGFVALDLDELRLKFLKDSWRYVGGNYNPELEVYEKLYKAGVKNIATIEGGGDVTYPSPVDALRSKPQAQNTSSHVHLGDDKVSRLLQCHNRILIRQLGTPLERYHSSHNLCYYLLLILKGHESAWLAGVLHRDISPNNMLIDEEPEEGGSEAFLLDWDLCRYTHQLSTARPQKTRSGTWAFISALLLLYSPKQHELADDLESFLHVLHWFCLRFHTHDRSHKPSEIADILSNVYFKTYQEQGYDVGGWLKFTYMKYGTRCFKLVKEEVAPGLEQIVAQLSKLFQAHYATVDIRALERAREELLYPKGTLPTLQRPDPRPSTRKTKKQRRNRLTELQPIMSRPPAHANASPAVTPKELPPNVLVTHTPMINIFQLALSDASNWIMPTPSRLPQPEVEPDDDSMIILPTDKIPDQFIPEEYPAIITEPNEDSRESQSLPTGGNDARPLQTLIAPNFQGAKGFVLWELFSEQEDNHRAMLLIVTVSPLLATVLEESEVLCDHRFFLIFIRSFKFTVLIL